jgi:hypothetical protein
MSHSGSIAGIPSRRCHSPPLLQLRVSSDTLTLNAPVRRYKIFQNVDPWVPKHQSICCSVVAMRPSGEKTHFVPNVGMLFGCDAQAPGPEVAEALGGLEAIISNTMTPRLLKLRGSVFCSTEFRFSW